MSSFMQSLSRGSTARSTCLYPKMGTITGLEPSRIGEIGIGHVKDEEPHRTRSGHALAAALKYQQRQALLKFVAKLDDEQARALREGLDQTTLALFDLLKKEELTPADIKRIKQVAVDLYARLREELARIRDWEQKQATRDQVKQTIFDFLYSDETGLPESYSEDEITMKSNLIFGHFLTQQQHGVALAAG